ncbi:MAG: AmmeMemoRadiSam system protein B, partial [Kiloniellales bacterium]
LFYPGEPDALDQAVGGYLKRAAPVAEGAEAAVPKAVIAPHAGYIYSGPVAANVYARLAPAREAIRRVVLLGPAHRVPLSGLAVSGADAFLTPLGPVPVDPAAVEAVLALPQVEMLDAAHEGEHSLEVHLPFLLRVLDRFAIVPIVAGQAGPDPVAEVLELLWGGDETLILISSDLSHYHDYDTARRRDAETSRAIEALRPEAIGPHDACGSMAIGGLLRVAERRGLEARTIDLRNSGDTAGPRDRVVGYGAYLFR